MNAVSASLRHALLAPVVLLLCGAAPASHPCAQCHSREVTGYEATAMAHALSRPTELPSVRFTHAVSKTKFAVHWDNGRLVQSIERDGISAQHDMAWAIGSGTHAFGFLIQIGDALFQSPIAWYTARKTWDVAPGYEADTTPDFNRPVTPECVFCHAGQARPVRGTLNRYQQPPFVPGQEGITCERCHGPVAAHLRAPVPGSIVNPAKLSPRARDSICEQCHLSGVARIPNPGRTVSDFRAGMELEDIFSVYVFAGSRDPSRARALKVISHVQQLALSTCARQSHGKMWCGSCHDPHQQPADPKAYFRARCLACHGTALLATHAKPADDCIGCHMPKRSVSDGGHTSFTDHHILRFPQFEQGEDLPEPLVAWREPPASFADRNLGLADVEVGRRYRSARHMVDGLRLLSSAKRDSPLDPAISTGIGMVLLGMHRGRSAAASFAQAIQVEPGVASHYLDEGYAWWAAGDRTRATASLEHALQLEPLLEQAYVALAGIYKEAGDAEKVRETWDRYARAFPGNIEAQQARRLMAAGAP